jgi:hypothetical protein
MLGIFTAMGKERLGKTLLAWLMGGSNPDSHGMRGEYTVKKVIDFPFPSRDVTNQTLPGRE